MYIFRKKRFLLILFILCISFSNYLISSNKKAQNLKNRDYSITQVSSLPVTEKVVVIDAGHGGEDGGAVSLNGTSESSINLKIALKLQHLLEQANTTVILTRSDENAIYEIDSKTLAEKKSSDIKNRVKIGNNANADIFVSIHLNKFPQAKYYGWQTFYNEKSEGGKLLANSIQASLNECIKRENTRVSKPIKDIYIVENVEIPLALVECGFLSNPEEAHLLTQDEYQNKIAFGIFVGITNYF